MPLQRAGGYIASGCSTAPWMVPIRARCTPMVFTLITGWAVDRFSYTPVFFGFGALPLVCAAILWIFTDPLTPAAAASTRTTPLRPQPIR
jgi:hypothetical protein